MQKAEGETVKPSYFARERKLYTQDQMMAKLAERIGQSARDGISVGRAVSVTEQHPVSVPISNEPTPGAILPKALTERPIALAWMNPVVHGDQTGFQLSIGGAYSVVKSRTNGEFVYQTFIRLPTPRVISTVKSSLEGRNAAQKHFEDNPRG